MALLKVTDATVVASFIGTLKSIEPTTNPERCRFVIEVKGELMSDYTWNNRMPAIYLGRKLKLNYVKSSDGQYENLWSVEAQ